jgi:hypothetical protein
VDLAAFLDGTLSAQQRREASDHLASCGRCRDALTASAVTLREQRRPRVRLTAATSVAIAAGLAALFIVPAVRDAGVAPEPLERGDQAEGIPTFAAFAPRDGAEVAADGVSFRWAEAGPDARYQITVTDELGDVVWTAPTRETVFEGPGTDVFAAGAVYYWYVDALLDGGRVARTAVLEFRTVP